MSTRATLVRKEGLHIFEEVLTNDVCFDIIDELAQKNDKYGDPCITREEAVQMARGILFSGATIEDVVEYWGPKKLLEVIGPGKCKEHFGLVDEVI